MKYSENQTLIRLAMTLTLPTLLFACATQAPEVPPDPPSGAAAEAHEVTPTDAAEAFVAHLREGRVARAHAMFDATVAGAMTATQLSELWAQLQAQHGAIVGVEVTGTQDAGAVTVVLLTATLEGGQGLGVQVALDAEQKVAGLHFAPPTATWEPPPYVDREAFTEQEVTFGEAPWILPGTLSVPVGDGPWPGVVLVHGSGAQDRDETLGANKPLKDLAWGLASQGIATLRYDKRNLALREQVLKAPPLTVSGEVIDDAAAALRWLSARPEVDARRVVVIGHSHSAGLLFRIMASHPQVAGGVALAAPARPFEDAMVDQVIYLSGLDGEVSDAEQAMIDEFAAARDRVKALTEADRGDVDTVLFGVNPAWWLELGRYEPARELARIPKGAPLLMLQGERDYHVTMEDFAVWRALLAKRAGATSRSYPGLNHLFMPGEGPPSPADYETPGHVAPAVMDEIARWVKARRRK